MNKHKVGDLILRIQPDEIGIITNINMEEWHLPYTVRWCQVNSIGYYNERSIDIMKRSFMDAQT